MSLIALTDRLDAGRSMARTLLVLIAVTGAVIVGLLAMHSLNPHTASGTGHQANVTVTAVASTGADPHHAGPTATDGQCADCGSSHSDMLAMACVLALLVTLLLLERTRATLHWQSTSPYPRPVDTSSANQSPSRPPSLSALCISRT